METKECLQANVEEKQSMYPDLKFRGTKRSYNSRN